MEDNVELEQEDRSKLASVSDIQITHAEQENQEWELKVS